ncbi:MAG: hypothetical protein QOI61_1320 [Actinomycetota bacterium]|jgi:hypothetical protein
MSRPRRLLLVVVVLCACLPAAAAATPVVQLTAAFAPGARLGAGAALRIGLRIDPRQPSAVTEIHLWYPASLGIATSGLGLATCRHAVLEAHGPAACPPNSVMGYGFARVEARPFGIRESARLTLLAGSERNGHLDLLVYADGEQPASVQMIDPGQLRPAPPPYGGDLAVQLLPIPGLDEITIALLHINFSLGARDITYYDYSRHKPIAYHPDGIALPGRCPRGGFPFHADLSFADLSHNTANATVRCPPASKAAPGRAIHR